MKKEIQISEAIVADHEHEWERNGVIDREGADLIIEYVCVNRDCDARFTETEPIDFERPWDDLD